MSYADKDNASELSGIAAAEISDEMLDQVDNYINTLFGLSTPFGVIADKIEYFNIHDRNDTELMLSEIPISELVEIIDNAQGDPTVINLDCFFLDEDTGIITIVSDVKNLTTGNIIYSFTHGKKSVKVSYKYGYSEVPTDVEKFATLLIAKWAEINNEQADADGLSSIAIGDYREGFDLKFMGIKSKYDEDISTLKRLLSGKYSKGV